MVSRPQLKTEDVVEPRLPPIVWVTREEANRQFDDLARDRLGMSGPEFLRRLDAGEWKDLPDDDEHRSIIEVAFMSALGR